MARKRPVTRWVFNLEVVEKLEAGHHTVKVAKVSNNHATHTITMKVELCAK